MTLLIAFKGDLVTLYAQLQLEGTLFSKLERSRTASERHSSPGIKQSRGKYSADVRRYPQRVRQLFSVPRVARASLASCIVMASQYVNTMPDGSYDADVLHATIGH